MNLSTNQRIIIITVFAAYTIFQLVYSLVTRKAMANGKGDYLSNSIPAVEAVVCL